jgi:hypothetical protein
VAGDVVAGFLEVVAGAPALDDAGVGAAGAAAGVEVPLPGDLRRDPGPPGRYRTGPIVLTDLELWERLYRPSANMP